MAEEVQGVASINNSEVHKTLLDSKGPRVLTPEEAAEERKRANVDAFSRVKEALSTKLNLSFYLCTSFTLPYLWPKSEKQADEVFKTLNGTPVYSEATVLANGISALLATLAAILIVFFRDKLPAKIQKTLFSSPKEKGSDPWYRRFKTAFVFGVTFGQLLGAALPIPVHIPILGTFAKSLVGVISAIICGLLFGAFAALFLPKNFESNQYFKIGSDGWSKYGKNSLVLGTQIGASIGGIIGLCLPIPGGFAAGMAIGALIGGIAGFVISTVCIPLINKLTIHFRKKSKYGDLAALENFRTNYIRAGVVLGGAMGALIGGLLGTFLFPGLGTVAGATLGSALGGALGGVIVVGLGKYITKKVDPDNNAANTFDYAIRTSAMFGNNMGLGSIFIAFLGAELGILLSAVSTLVCGIAGAAREFYHGWKLSKLAKENGDKALEADRNYRLPWSQRVAAGIATGSAIGGIVGFLFGGAEGAMAGMGIGGIITGAIAVLADPGTWKPLKEGVKTKFNALSEKIQEGVISEGKIISQQLKQLKSSLLGFAEWLWAKPPQVEKVQDFECAPPETNSTGNILGSLNRAQPSTLNENVEVPTGSRSTLSILPKLGVCPRQESSVTTIVYAAECDTAFLSAPVAKIDPEYFHTVSSGIIEEYQGVRQLGPSLNK